MQEACYVICNAVTTGQQSAWLTLLSRDRYQALLKALIKALKKQNVAFVCAQEIMVSLLVLINFAIEHINDETPQFEGALVLEAIANSDIFQHVEKHKQNQEALLKQLSTKQNERSKISKEGLE